MATSCDSDLSILIERIARVSRLLDHQAWEAANGIALDKSSACGRRFARLVEDGALLEAAVLLVSLCKPSRSIASIAISGRAWICVIRGRLTNGDGITRTHQAEHADLAAAVLMALLSSRPDGLWTTGNENVSSPRLQSEFDHHGI